MKFTFGDTIASTDGKEMAYYKVIAVGKNKNWGFTYLIQCLLSQKHYVGQTINIYGSAGFELADKLTTIVLFGAQT